MWDGKGYPEGISGEAIPLGARILSVVDCYDALTSDRPYRRALTREQAIAVLVERRGTHYAPRVVDKFIEVCDRLVDASDDAAHVEMVAGKAAEIREVIAPRTNEIDEAPALDDRPWTPRGNEQTCVLPTFAAISRYLETVVPGAVTVLYSHEVERARLVATDILFAGARVPVA
jgi:hypothetical protein